MSDNFQVNKQFAKFKGKDVLIGLKNFFYFYTDFYF